jgi:hypothetical protein
MVKRKSLPGFSPVRISFQGDIMYQFKEEIDYNGYYWFDKKLIKNKNWALLPQASRSIYPVILNFKNGVSGLSFPCQETIAILSGTCETTVSNGIKHLDGFPDLKIIPYITGNGKRSNQFQIKAQPNIRGRSFPFKSSVFTGGNWSQLKPTAQSLYPVLRCFSYFDLNTYGADEDLGTDPDDFEYNFNNRKYEYFDGEMDILAQHAGITNRSLTSAFESLEESELIEWFDEVGWRGWKVFIEPKLRFKQSFLNEKSIKKFAHKKRKPPYKRKNYGSHNEKAALKTEKKPF